VEDDRLAGLHEAQRRQIADVGGGDFGVVVEVVVLDGTDLLEAGCAHPARDARRLAPGEFVFADVSRHVFP